MTGNVTKFKGVLKLFPKELGGRHTPAKSAYMVDIAYKDTARFAKIDFLDREQLSPGESCQVHLLLWLHNDEELDFYIKNKKAFVLSGLKKIGEVELLESL